MQYTLARARTGISLGSKLGQGGEGAVYSIEGQKDQVAKIYTSPPDSHKVQKLLAMSQLANSSLLKIAAWPIDLLTDNRGAVSGFIMPRMVARRDIHELYTPKSRSDAFPVADFRFLVHVCANIARAFAVVHEQGHVVGDINHGNLLVGLDGTVMFIDCDSFQISNGSHVFTCDVGVPLFTAPELQGRSYRGLVRTANHDIFGLAVLLFHLLFMGRHPFAGRYSGFGDMPIERAISEYRFAYAPDRVSNGMERPPATIPLETMGATIAQLFVQAFDRAGSNGGRPPAKTWLEAIEKMLATLSVCTQASWHHYPKWLKSCPWCAVESQSGVRLFGQRIAEGAFSGTFDLATLWNAISAIPSPSADPSLPSERLWHLPSDVKIPSKSLNIFRKVLGVVLVCAGLAGWIALTGIGFFILFLISCGLAYAVWPRVSSEKYLAADRNCTAARTEWEGVLNLWKREASLGTFTAKLKSLEQIRAEVADQPNERLRRLNKLEAERETFQRQRYLDRYRIEKASIRGIASGRIAMLISYGIETAADINRGTIMQIPGFGEVLASELVRWRQGHEVNFRFNPNEPLDRRDIEAMDHALLKRRQDLLPVLRKGPSELMRLSQEIIAARQRLMPILSDKWNAFKIAEARLKALS